VIRPLKNLQSLGFSSDHNSSNQLVQPY